VADNYIDFTYGGSGNVYGVNSYIFTRTKVHNNYFKFTGVSTGNKIGISGATLSGAMILGNQFNFAGGVANSYCIYSAGAWSVWYSVVSDNTVIDSSVCSINKIFLDVVGAADGTTTIANNTGTFSGAVTNQQVFIRFESTSQRVRVLNCAVYMNNTTAPLSRFLYCIGAPTIGVCVDSCHFATPTANEASICNIDASASTSPVRIANCFFNDYTAYGGYLFATAGTNKLAAIGNNLQGANSNRIYRNGTTSTVPVNTATATYTGNVMAYANYNEVLQ